MYFNVLLKINEFNNYAYLCQKKVIMRTAIAFLTRFPHQETMAFASQIAQNKKYDVFIISDTPNNLQCDNVCIVRLDDSICINSGFVNSNISTNATHIKKNPIAWDKMLYYFCRIANTYEFVWVFEDDCFIPSISTIHNLHKKYSYSDFVSPNDFLKMDNGMDWHWLSVVDKIKPPYYYSMVCACGISRKLLKAVDDYVKKNNELFYIEVMFNTLAHHQKLKVTDAFELKSIVWMGKWELDEYLLLPNNIFHPKKELDQFENYRKEIKKAKRKKYQPINNLPPFLLP
jgi:hypothetical protein